MVKQFRNYAMQKTAASAFFDVALFMANVSQLKAVLDATTVYGMRQCLILALVSLSMLLQLVLGFMLIYLCRGEQAIGKRYKHVSIDLPRGQCDRDRFADGLMETEEGAGLRRTKSKEEIIEEDLHQHGVINMAATCLVFAILMINVTISGMGLGTGTDFYNWNDDPVNRGTPAQYAVEASSGNFAGDDDDEY